jgi:hypothetical protein
MPRIQYTSTAEADDAARKAALAAERGPAYLDKVRSDIQTAVDAYSAAFTEFRRRYHDLLSAAARADAIGLDHPTVNEITFDLRRDLGLDLPRDVKPTATVFVGTLLGKLAELGVPEPEPEPHEPVKRRSPIQRDPGLDAEIAEREASERAFAKLKGEHGTGHGWSESPKADAQEQLVEAGEDRWP